MSNGANTNAAVTILEGLLSQAIPLVTVLKTASADGGRDLTDAEVQPFLDAEAASKKAQEDDLAKRGG